MSRCLSWASAWRNIAAWWRRCRRTGAEGMLITSWESGRLAAELPLAIDAAAAGLWLDGEEDPRRLWSAGCRRAFGNRVGRAAISAAADVPPFFRVSPLADQRTLGHARRRRAAPTVAAQARTCRRLARTAGLPLAIKASLDFRRYVAERDLFVREAGRTVWKLRNAAARGRRATVARILRRTVAAADGFSGAIRAGRAAARLMWRRTRDGRVIGPNERILVRDADRLRAWRAWLRRGEGAGSGIWRRRRLRAPGN